MYILFVVPMILFFTVESLLWKKNRQAPFVTLLGTTFWSLVCVGAVFLLSFIWEENVFINYSWAIFGWTLLQVSLIIANILLWVAVMKSLPLSIAEPVALFRVILLTIFAALIFGGALGWQEITLVSVMFVSCVGLSVTQTIGKKRSVDKSYAKGLFLVFLWVLTSVGINLIMTNILRNGVKPITHATIQTATMFAVVMLIFLINRPKQIKESYGIVLKNKVHVGIGFSGVLGRVCFSLILSLTAINVGILTAIQMAVVALVVIYSVIFLKERPKPLSYVFIVLIIASAILLSLL